MKLSSNGHTDIGRRRSRNEDSLLIDDALGLYVVSDGMGGHAGGDIASSIAVQTLARYVNMYRHEVTDIRHGLADESRMTSILITAASEAGKAIATAAGASPELASMGCTLTALLIGDTKAVMAHVGDSRLYLERKGWVRQLSVDHTTAQQLRSRGILGIAQRRFGHVPENGLTRALGVNRDVEIDHLVIDLKPGDRFVLCTDGFSSYLANAQHLSVLLDTDGTPELLSQRLIDFANARGGRDNITAVVVTIADQAGAGIDIPAHATWREYPTAPITA